MWKFWRRGREIIAPRISARESGGSSRVDLKELTPQLTPFLGQAACLQMAFSGLFTGAVGTSETLRQKDVLSEAAQTAWEKYHGLIDLAGEGGGDPTAVVQPFSASIDAFVGKISSDDWAEQVTSGYLASGLLDDFFLRLGDGLPGRAGHRIQELLARDPGREDLAALLTEAISRDGALDDRLALWGRRLVGDTMLIARSALVHTGNLPQDESRIEPVFTELLNDHVRRMEILGLTA